MLPETPDPRPQIVEADGAHLLAGWRCGTCGHAVAFVRPSCSRCRRELVAATFGPGGRIWAATIVRVSTPGFEAPYGLAYLDLDDGPRILVHVPPEAVPVGSLMVLAGTNDAGNPMAVPA